MSEEYGPTKEHHLLGSGQGSGGFPTFWAVIADVLFNYIDKRGAGMILVSPTRDRVRTRNEERYVNDTALGVDRRDNNMVDRITTTAQQHKRTIYATGGKLAIKHTLRFL